MYAGLTSHSTTQTFFRLHGLKWLNGAIPVSVAQEVSCPPVMRKVPASSPGSAVVRARMFTGPSPLSGKGVAPSPTLCGSS